MLETWAGRWRVPPEAMKELREIMGGSDTGFGRPDEEHSEAYIQTQLRLEASKAGCRLWRNNVGMLTDDRGVPVRYGLCNESKQMNQKIKSSDLIGINPITIGPEHLGCVIGQFVAREVKRGDWKYTGRGREAAQMKFIEIVTALGGDAAFTNSIDNPVNKYLLSKGQEDVCNDRNQRP